MKALCSALGFQIKSWMGSINLSAFAHYGSRCYQLQLACSSLECSALLKCVHHCLAPAHHWNVPLHVEPTLSLHRTTCRIDRGNIDYANSDRIRWYQNSVLQKHDGNKKLNIHSMRWTRTKRMKVDQFRHVLHTEYYCNMWSSHYQRKVQSYYVIRAHVSGQPNSNPVGNYSVHFPSKFEKTSKKRFSVTILTRWNPLGFRAPED